MSDIYYYVAVFLIISLITSIVFCCITSCAALCCYLKIRIARNKKNNSLKKEYTKIIRLRFDTIVSTKIDYKKYLKMLDAFIDPPPKPALFGICLLIFILNFLFFNNFFFSKMLSNFDTVLFLVIF